MQLYTAIIFIKDRDYPIKYRNINDVARFVKWVQHRFPLYATAINFYEKESKIFFKQVKIQNDTK